MTINELLISFSNVKDNTRLGILIKEPGGFIPENDNEFIALSNFKIFLKTFFDDMYSSYITAETIKKVLDETNEFYNPEKLERVAMFIRNRLKPAQPLTKDWLIYFVRRFK